jgi:hypothetical protein
MGLKDKWAESRELERAARERQLSYVRRLNKSAELRRMGVTSHEPAGVLDPSLTEADLDGMIGAEKQRRSEMYDAVMRAGTVTVFRALGVQLLKGGDVIYTLGLHDGYSKTNTSRPLGPLAGAAAQVTDGTSAFSLGKALLMPLATAPLASKQTADALITFTNGTIHSFALDGSQAVRDARKECVQFNAMAGAPTIPVPAAADGDPASRLRKLQELLDAGLVSADEFKDKRAAILDSI